MAATAATELPLCPICCDTLGKYGGPATLPCGHNGCLDCLATTQATNPLCPLCRAPFADRSLVCNPELRDLITMATSFCMDDKSKQEGWEAFPTARMTADHYAQELRLERQPPPHDHDALSPYNPSAPPMGGPDGGTGASSPYDPYHQPPPRYPAPHHEDPEARELLLLEPPQWLPDSFAQACCSCHQPFKPLTRLRHHCRMCGKIFCHACCHKRMLLPPKYRQKDPQRVCEMCRGLLAPLQGYIAGNWSRAVQAPVQDAPDSVSLRSWVNPPYCPALEEDLFKTANILRTHVQAARLQPEKTIPSAVLQGARGLAIISALRVGAGWSCTFGTGVVVARQGNGDWSAPCAVACWGVGWGLQVGGQLTDLLLVLRSDEAVRAFTASAHLSVGGSASASMGPVGRHAEAQLLVNSEPTSHRPSHRPAPPNPPVCSYSISRGAFLGVAVDTTLVAVRATVNHDFYGYPVTARQLLLDGSVPQPPAAALLYSGLQALTEKYEGRGRLGHGAGSRRR